MRKNTVELDRPQVTIRRKRIAWWIATATHAYARARTHTHTTCNTYCYFTATMAARTRLTVTLYCIAHLDQHSGGMPVDMTDSLNTAFMHIV